MVRKWVTWINYFACGLIAVLLFGAICFFLMRQTTFALNEGSLRKPEIPKGAFARSVQEYESIGAPALSLTFSPLNIQLPDLRRYLVFYGKNGRPDALNDRPALFFAFAGNKMLTSLFPNDRLYLFYDKKLTPAQYVFSENNVPTPIWMEASTQGNHAWVRVSMQGENGQVIREPAAYADFSLPEKEFVRFGGTVWELGKWRVDGTLLARQKARWFGVDKFLDKHGGEEYQDLIGKQRLDFSEGNDVYSVYVGPGDCLIWKDGRWHNAKAGAESLQYPLMCIKKVDERVMNLELWDVDGKGKISLNMVRANEAWMPQNLEQSFKFIGARTRSQFVFEINKERMILRPHDWLLFTESSWRKLTTPQQIDDYVERRVVGPLFVFDRVERKDDRQVIIGTFFNAARTEMVNVELPLQQNTGQRPGGLAGEKNKKTKETNTPSVLKTGNLPSDRPVNKNALRPSDSGRANDDEQD